MLKLMRRRKKVGAWGTKDDVASGTEDDVHQITEDSDGNKTILVDGQLEYLEDLDGFTILNSFPILNFLWDTINTPLQPEKFKETLNTVTLVVTLVLAMAVAAPTGVSWEELVKAETATLKREFNRHVALGKYEIYSAEFNETVIKSMQEYPNDPNMEFEVK